MQRHFLASVEHRRDHLLRDQAVFVTISSMCIIINCRYIYILLTADNGTSRMRTTLQASIVPQVGGSIRIAYTYIHTHSHYSTIHSSIKLHCIVIEARPSFNFTSLLSLLLFLFPDLLEGKVKKGIQVPTQQTLGSLPTQTLGLLPNQIESNPCSNFTTYKVHTC